MNHPVAVCHSAARRHHEHLLAKFESETAVTYVQRTTCVLLRWSAVTGVRVDPVGGHAMPFRNTLRHRELATGLSHTVLAMLAAVWVDPVGDHAMPRPGTLRRRVLAMSLSRTVLAVLSAVWVDLAEGHAITHRSCHRPGEWATGSASKPERGHRQQPPGVCVRNTFCRLVPGTQQTAQTT